MEIERAEVHRDEQEKAQRTRVRTRRIWWLLPVAVLFLLLAVIYVLGHMSSTDSEMYPTTQRRSTTSVRHC